MRVLLQDKALALYQYKNSSERTDLMTRVDQPGTSAELYIADRQSLNHRQRHHSHAQRPISITAPDPGGGDCRFIFI